MFYLKDKKTFLEHFHHYVFAYPAILPFPSISSNHNELIWTKLRYTMVINRDGYPLCCWDTCIVVNNIHCPITTKGPNLSFEINHAEITSSYWNPRHLYPAVGNRSIFIAIFWKFKRKYKSSADEDP